MTEIVVSASRADVPSDVRDHLTDKLSRMERFGTPLMRIRAEVVQERNPRLADRAFKVEVTATRKGPVIRAEAAAPDPHTAVDLAVRKLEEQLRRVASRHQDHGRNHHQRRPEPEPIVEVSAEPSVEVAEPLPPDVILASGPLIVREKTHETVPMTVEDALDALESVGHDFYLFEDSANGAVSVVYRRKGYDFGLIRLSVRRSG